MPPTVSLAHVPVNDMVFIFLDVGYENRKERNNW